MARGLPLVTFAENPAAMTKEAILQIFEFYRDAPEPDRQALARAVDYVYLPERTVFYREGETCTHFGLVGQGKIRVYKTGPDGREMTLYHVRDGEPCVVNMLCVFLERGAMASAATEAPTDAVSVPAPLFRSLIASNERLRRFVFETMAVRLVDVMTLVEEITLRRMDARLASHLLRTIGGRTPERALIATHDDLAAQLGTAREVVCRILEELERAGAIRRHRGRITLVDEHVLAKVAGAAHW